MEIGESREKAVWEITAKYEVSFEWMEHDDKSRKPERNQFYFTIPRNQMFNPEVVILWIVLGLYLGNPTGVITGVLKELNDRIVGEAIAHYVCQYKKGRRPTFVPPKK